MQVFYDTFSRYISQEENIVLAISGGVDSMVLLDLVAKCHPHTHMIVAHFDHSLRGSESDGDRELVVNLCERCGIRCEVMKVDIGELAQREKNNLEAVARRERYHFFRTLAARFGARLILTAHHRDDQMETILLNLLKGAKVGGLSGMPFISGDIFRPMLTLSKEMIRSYASEHQILFRDDSSNMDTHFDRNKIRQQVVPILRTLNPQVSNTFSELASYMQELGRFMESYCEQWLESAFNRSYKPNSFLISDFQKESVFIQGELISFLYKRSHHGSTHGLSRGLIAELIRFITQGSNSYGVRTIGELSLERRGERVFYGFN